jgi:hypothetical protein
MGGTCSVHEEMSNAYKIVVVMPEVKRPQGRPRRRWEDNTEKDFRETGWEGEGCINLGQNKHRWRVLVNTVMNLWVP